MESWLSGFALASPLEFLGEEFLDDPKLIWRGPDDLLEALSKDGKPVSQRVFWFYRSPARLSASKTEEGLGEVLQKWVEVNRSVLRCRQRHDVDLHFINVDLASRVDCLAALKGGGTSRPDTNDDPEVSCGDGEVAAFEHLVRFAVPDAWEVYETLEAVASFRPERNMGSQPVMPSEDQFLAVLELAQHGKDVPALRASLEEAVATSGKGAGEVSDLLQELHRTQEEFEQFYLKSLSLETELEASRKAQETLQAERVQMKRTMSKRESMLLARVDSELSVSRQLRQERTALAREVAQLKDDARIHTKHMLATAGLAAENQRPGAASRAPAALEARWERRQRMKRRRHVLETIGRSTWFDGDWYLAQYPDVGRTGLDPVAHYVDFGWKEGRKPGPGFDTVHYLKSYPDVVASGMNPLFHFIRHGEGEERSPRGDA